MDMHTQQEKASILLIYTGGTIGMIENPETGVLESFNFQHLKDNMPELKKLGYSVATIQFDPPMDSSEMGPDSWMKIVKLSEIRRLRGTAWHGYNVVYGIGFEFYAREPE